eukprot:1163498-Pleurochrysis_carterae.AAC.1
MLRVVGRSWPCMPGGGPAHELWGRLRPQQVCAHFHAGGGMGTAEAGGVRRRPTTPPRQSP